MNPKPLKDSGERREFNTGAVRDRGDLKPRPDLISPHAQMREGMIHTLGSEKYAVRNWEKGMPISECLASAQRHIEQYKRGDTDEDHLAQARWNLGAMIHYEEEIAAGRLDPSLDDLPKYNQIEAPKGAPQQTPEIDTGTLSYNPTSRESTTPTFYITGPMRGIPLYNFPEFDRAAAYAKSLGLNVINPAQLDREMGIDPVNDLNGAVKIISENLNFLSDVVRRDCSAILNLRKERGDGIILLPDWQNSMGARAEVALALWLELEFKLFFPGKEQWEAPRLTDVLNSDIIIKLFFQPKNRPGGEDV